MTEVAILHGIRDDVYVIVGTINPQTKVATFQIHVNPLVSWIWLGCLVLIAGSIVCMWPQLELGESRVWAGAQGTAAVAASVLLGIMLAATPTARAQDMSHEGIVHIESAAERSIFENVRCMCGDCARDLLSTCPCSTAEVGELHVAARGQRLLVPGDDAVRVLLVKQVVDHGVEDQADRPRDRSREAGVIPGSASSAVRAPG